MLDLNYDNYAMPQPPHELVPFRSLFRRLLHRLAVHWTVPPSDGIMQTDADALLAFSARRSGQPTTDELYFRPRRRVNVGAECSINLCCPRTHARTHHRYRPIHRMPHYSSKWHADYMNILTITRHLTMIIVKFVTILKVIINVSVKNKCSDSTPGRMGGASKTLIIIIILIGFFRQRGSCNIKYRNNY